MNSVPAFGQIIRPPRHPLSPPPESGSARDPSQQISRPGDHDVEMIITLPVRHCSWHQLIPETGDGYRKHRAHRAPATINGKDPPNPTRLCAGRCRDHQSDGLRVMQRAASYPPAGRADPRPAITVNASIPLRHQAARARAGMPNLILRDPGCKAATWSRWHGDGSRSSAARSVPH